MRDAPEHPEPGETAARRLDWQWRAAAVGAIDAVPAAVVTAVAVPSGVALAVGVLPAAIIGLPPTRRARAALILVGILTGLPMVLGSFVAGTPLLATAVVFALAVGAAALAQTTVAKRRDLGRVLSTLSVPLVGVGLSYDVLVVGTTPSPWVYGVAVLAVVATAAATHRSRWYVTSTFTTFLVFVLLLYSDPGQAGYRFTERLSETVLGVAIAFVFGIAVPALGRRTWSSH
ncbi:MAG: hypothetical protein EOP25_01765 [Rhodococcus sp. (in: high G+C Gram-positive bacteria)]|nr:MAG: hypothetical protein EOP25_01765 [Rhodococcus sp. (in: high G+C Gram-positive bacteria)]